MFDFKAHTLTNTEGTSYKETTQAVPAFHRSLGFFLSVNTQPPLQFAFSSVLKHFLNTHKHTLNFLTSQSYMSFEVVALKH